MMPLLKLLNEKLLAWIDGVDVFIPAILIVQDMEKGTKPMYVYRGFGVLGFRFEWIRAIKSGFSLPTGIFT